MTRKIGRPVVLDGIIPNQVDGVTNLVPIGK